MSFARKVQRRQQRKLWLRLEGKNMPIPFKPSAVSTVVVQATDRLAKGDGYRRERPVFVHRSPNRKARRTIVALARRSRPDISA